MLPFVFLLKGTSNFEVAWQNNWDFITFALNRTMLSTKCFQFLCNFRSKPRIYSTTFDNEYFIYSTELQIFLLIGILFFLFVCFLTARVSTWKYSWISPDILLSLCRCFCWPYDKGHNRILEKTLQNYSSWWYCYIYRSKT